jgi:hypothetical protein
MNLSRYESKRQDKYRCTSYRKLNGNYYLNLRGAEDMADRMAAEIWIGSKLPRSLLHELPISDLRLDWDENPFDASSEEGILSARDKDGLLHFADCEIAWGEFQELESWLRGHNMPFQRQSAGKYECDPCFVEFRPDLPGKPDRYTLTNQDGAPVICREKVEKIVRSMARLVKDRKRPAGNRLRAWERLYNKLLRLCPPKLPPLPTFEVVDG